MKGKIIQITPKSRFVCYLIRLATGKCAITYTGEQYRNYTLWKEYKIGDMVDGLRWKDETKNLLDADSPIHFI